jgi:hypothetical protein
MSLPLAAILVFASSYSFGQVADSVALPPSSPDASISREKSALDSVRNSAANEFVSIKTSYDSIISVTGEQTTRLSAEIDSLEKLNQPVEELSGKVDSIMQWKDERITALNDKVEKLKTSVMERINGLNLPPELAEKGRDLTTMVNELDVSLPNTDIPTLRGLENPLSEQSIPGLENIELKDVNLGEVGEQISHYQDQLPALPATMEEASSIAEEQAMKIAEVNELSDQLGEAASVTEMASLPDEQAVKEELVQKAQQQAIDHFQGKEEQLQKAMETLAKYKQKYSKLEGLDQIPKKKPNAMRGKPFIERLIPGIALQIHRKDAWMVDFNLYAGYRFNSRLTAGAGWNQRVAYNADEYEFDPDLRVYGPRFYGEFVIGQGFSGRLESEYMNTRLPPQFASGNADPDSREWVYSTMAGVKKEYRFLGKVKGTMMLLYNLHDPQHRSPYVDKLMVRFGFEFARKKATKH